MIRDPSTRFDGASTDLLQVIRERVVTRLDVSEELIFSNSQARLVVLARRMAVTLGRRLTVHDDAMLAVAFGLTDGIQVRRAFKEFSQQCHHDYRLSRMVFEIEHSIGWDNAHPDNHTHLSQVMDAVTKVVLPVVAKTVHRELMKVESERAKAAIKEREWEQPHSPFAQSVARLVAAEIALQNAKYSPGERVAQQTFDTALKQLKDEFNQTENAKRGKPHG